MNFSSIAVAAVRSDGVERAYLGGQDFHVYEADESTQGKLTDLGKGPGVPWHMAAGDLRGDGRDRLYLTNEMGNTHEGGGTTISEYTYYEAPSLVAVLALDVEDGKSGGAGRTLASVFRTKLLQFEPLQQVETENIDKVLAEREFQKSRCFDVACIARIGRLLKAEAVIKVRFVRDGQAFSIDLLAADAVRGRPILALSKRTDSESDILPAIRQLAAEVALKWPHDLKSSGTEKR